MEESNDSVFSHDTVLLGEAVEALIGDMDGLYVDATFGRGGHTRKVLAGLSPNGRLIGFDKDPVAIAMGRELENEDPRFRIVHDSFANIATHLDQPVNGVLADLGVSSPQLDDAERGFSFINDGPLDMRMNSDAGQSAAEWLMQAEEVEIAQVLKDFGEERFSKRIARAIVEERSVRDLTTTLQLAKVVADANPAWEKNKHPATRAFQAIRIKVNNELGDLEALLEDASKNLMLGGRLVVISFHSLEDRMVKRFMREKAKGNTPPPGVPVMEKDIARPFKVFSKAIKPSKEEVERNVRSRSAVMRVMERISDD